MEEQKVNFKVGDRVRSRYLNQTFGELGTVCCFDVNYHIYGYIGIEFDNPVGNHDCGGTAKNRHGYYIYGKYLEKLNSVMTVKEWKNKK